jgi:hypothetical protein
MGSVAVRGTLGALLLAAAACGGAARTVPGGGAAPPGVIGSVLPPIPEVRGPLALYVEYPDSLQRITASDSNFIFGLVGTGDATLIINGQFVDVNPNGSFLGWLPVPPRTREATPGDTAAAAASDSASYLLVARRGEEIDTLRHWILLPRLVYEGPPNAPWIDPGSLEDRPEQWALPDETLEFLVRAAPGADLWLDAGRSPPSSSPPRRAGEPPGRSRAGARRPRAS